ncbi:hypothetical protein NONO_c59860 [Nocardia nova SH22a]|uniref:Uncharacterized protein n=1 Tax=Nocardia nova SH22a TaxID=1415166 RepID=W5TNC6_9NOCA|nr:hypothetical protein [Nocardia nova]AHH20762.1 hypothetical protein NONO_c59860 [Nocardia nova SH22a]
MSTVPATAPPDTEPIAEETIRGARMTVARFATDAADCAELLDMLGIGTDPRCVRCDGLMTSPDGLGKQHAGKDGVCWRCLRLAEETAKSNPATANCDCGRPAVRGESQCPMCRNLMSADKFRRAYARIQEATGESRAQICRAAGLNTQTVRTIVVPSSTRDRVTRKLYDQLVAAYKDEVDLN